MVNKLGFHFRKSPTHVLIYHIRMCNVDKLGYISKFINVLELSSNFLTLSVINLKTSDQFDFQIDGFPSPGNKASVFIPYI